MTFHHIPVLLKETIELLKCKPGDLIIDGTLGGGGHAERILDRIGPKGTLIGIDKDPAALKAAKEHLHRYGDSLITIHGNFANIKGILDELSFTHVDGIVLDLGVSSHQLDKGERGFSYQQDASLDMRMDPTQSLDAHKVVNEYSEKELTRIITQYGEERWAVRIAKFIVERRPINTTFELTEVIKAAIPAQVRRRGPHPSTRTFQAIRIEVNKELEILEEALRAAVEVLRPKGRLCTITFHSLEDRIVKNTFRSMERPCLCPPDSPICICNREPTAKVITRKPVIATDDEISYNRRSRSAKLRACQKL